MQLGRLKRREFVALLGASAAWPIAGHAQQAGKIFRSAITWANRVEALRGGLRDLGYVEEKNIVIEFRWTETIDQLPELATELVRMNVDVIFAPSSTEVEVARQATNAIPIRCRPASASRCCCRGRSIANPSSSSSIKAPLTSTRRPKR